jgi:hypothetical protein
MINTYRGQVKSMVYITKSYNCSSIEIVRFDKGDAYRVIKQASQHHYKAIVVHI